MHNRSLLFILILLAALIMRLVSLEINGLWLDEIWSMLASAPDQPMEEVIKNALGDTHPPLFDILLYWSLKLSDNAEFTARYLALIFGMLGVIGSWYYGKRIARDQRIGMLLMAICSFNFFHIYYSIEGRFYSLLFLLSLVCLGELILYFRERKKQHAWRYLAAAILLTYTHYYGGILLAALSVAALILVLIKEIDRSQFFNYVGLQLLILLAFSPCLPYLFGRSNSPSWISEPVIEDFINYFYLYSGKNPLEFLWLFLPLLFFFKVEKQRKLVVMLYSTVLISFLLPFALSHLSVPMLHKRYTLIYLPAIFLMSSMAWPKVKSLRWKRSRIIYVAIAFSCILNMAFLRDEFREGSKDSWKEVARYLKLKGAGEIVADQARYLNFYLKRMDVPKANDSFIDAESGQIWVLKTNFDEKDHFPEAEWKAIETKSFPKSFKLILYRENRDLSN